ncbi:MAG: HNH endonuclease [Pseudomonadales bacterium]
MVDANYDRAVRQRAFEFLTELMDRYGEVLPRSELEQGFTYQGHRVPLLAPQGIFKPRILDQPLTIATSPNSPYRDTFTDDGLIQYCYRGTDWKHRDNAGLRATMESRVPIIYIRGILPGKYVATWPVYVVADDPYGLKFTIAVDNAVQFPDEHLLHDSKFDLETALRRKYVTRETRTRLHQRAFRERVINAYRTQCAMCRLRHEELLDAAHITPDSEEGEPIVSNGIALCKIHHAAFDKNIIGIRPDYIVEVRKDILQEVDGPMLKYGLQQMAGTKIQLPHSIKNHPNRDQLEKQFDEFCRR